MRLLSLGVLAFSACSTLCVAQQVFSNETVTKMHAAGLTDDVIITTINAQPSGNFSTTANDLIALKSAGISDGLIAAMISKNAAPASPASGSGASVSSGGNASEATTPAAPVPRVFLTSQSHGTNRYSVRDQSMEMGKDFERDCSGVKISINQAAADYTVSLNHIEAGFFRDNQFQIADRMGDLIATTKEGGSIANGRKKACQTILGNWAIHSTK
ncbi:MAG: hypothetical protein ACRYF4_05150 [Janthinobacterium lividum]